MLSEVKTRMSPSGSLKKELNVGGGGDSGGRGADVPSRLGRGTVKGRCNDGPDVDITARQLRSPGQDFNGSVLRQNVMLD